MMKNNLFALTPGAFRRKIHPMGTYPAHYSGGELICIGDEAEWRAPDGRVQRVRIGTLDFLESQRREGRAPSSGLPTLHLMNENHPPAWYAVPELPLQRISPAGLTLIRRSGKLYYNNGVEIMVGDLVWDNGFRSLERVADIWHRGNPLHDWYFEASEHSGNVVIVFDPHNGAGGGVIEPYADAEGNRSAGMDHITFIERGQEKS